MSRIGPWLLALFLAIICAGTIGGVWYIRSAAQQSAANLQERLPTDVYAVIGIDFSALRKSGALSQLTPDSVIEEQDYRNFVSLTGFDYRSDLNYVLLGLAQDTKYILADGQFDWASIMKYAELNEGGCTFGFCRMYSTETQRHISYFAQRSDVIALGIGSNEWSANALEQKYEWSNDEKAPLNVPLWILLRAEIFQKPEEFPSTIQPWLHLLSGANRVILQLVPNDQGFQLQMKLVCNGAGTALRIQDRLVKATSELNSALVQEDKPIDGKSIPAVLANGKFTTKENQVEGVWIVQQDLVDFILSGSP